MAQTGYTPILNYSSATASAVPLAANLAQGELAVNTADGKLFYKDSAGVVQTMASKATGSIGGSTTQVQFNNSGALGGSASLTWSGTVLTSSGFAGPLNGTVGATTPAAGAFTTVSASGNVTLSGGTANGVAYLNGSKVLTSGSALTYDGTALTSTAGGLIITNAGSSLSTTAINFGSLSGGAYINTPAANTGYLTAGGNGAYSWSPILHTWAISSSEQMRLTSTGLGIGNASPQAKLSVGAGTTAPGFGTASKMIYVCDTTQPEVLIRETGGSVVTSMYSDSTTGNLRTATNHPLVFQTNNNERMRIDTSGNLGIGTSSPAAKLDVAKTSNDTVSRTNASGALGDFVSLGAGLLMQQTLSSPYGFALQAANAANSAQFPLLLNPSGGNVGIGTSSPSTKLQINTSNNTRGILLNNTATGLAGIELTSNSSTWYVENRGALNSNNLWISNISAALLVLSDSGNLGLGVTPSAWVSGRPAFEEIGGAVWSFGTANFYSLQNTYFDGVGFKYKNTAAASMYQQGSGIHYWYNAPSGTAGNAITFTQAMTLDASGNLGIGGSPAGDFRLTVTGNDTYLPGVNAINGTVVFSAYATSSAGTVATRSNHPLVFTTNSSERMRIDSSGSLLIGTTTNPTTGAFARPPLLIRQFNDVSAWSGIQIEANAETSVFGIGYNGTTFELGTSYRSTGGYRGISFNVGGSERVRIDTSGNLLVGTTSVIGSNGCVLEKTVDGGRLYVRRSNADNVAEWYFNSTRVGSVSITSSATSYNTGSDYRLKENIAPMTGALVKVSALKPCTFKWKSDGSDGQGFIAHELQAVVPDCVTGEKDAVDEDGNPKYQGIDTSFLVATLTAAIQELKAEFDAYKASHP